MSELRDVLKEEFKDREVRHIYCGDFLNSSIATQIKVLREERNITQSDLAKLAGMRQSRIAAIEDVNYSSWCISTLRRIAEAFDLALTVQFDSFGAKLADIVNFKRDFLEKPSFENDPVFQADYDMEPIKHPEEASSKEDFDEKMEAGDQILIPSTRFSNTTSDQDTTALQEPPSFGSAAEGWSDKQFFASALNA